MEGALSGWSGHFVVDPSEMESRYANEDGLAYLGSIFEGASDESQRKIERVRELLDLLPPREADFIDLYFFKRMRQTDIARVFGVSQPTVCYRLVRAAKRLRFLLDAPDISVDDLERDLPTILQDPLDVRIMILMWETTCQSEVALRLGVSQGLVRHRFLRAIEILQKSQYPEYATAFEFVADHLIILREVKRISEDRANRCIY